MYIFHLLIICYLHFSDHLLFIFYVDDGFVEEALCSECIKQFLPSSEEIGTKIEGDKVLILTLFLR